MFISLSVLLSLSDAVAEVYIPAVARSDDAMRRWSNGVGLWGKRSASPYPQDIGSWNEKRAATFQIDSNPEVRYQLVILISYLCLRITFVTNLQKKCYFLV